MGVIINEFEMVVDEPPSTTETATASEEATTPELSPMDITLIIDHEEGRALRTFAH